MRRSPGPLGGPLSTAGSAVSSSCSRAGPPSSLVPAQKSGLSWYHFTVQLKKRTDGVGESAGLIWLVPLALAYLSA